MFIVRWPTARSWLKSPLNGTFPSSRYYPRVQMDASQDQIIAGNLSLCPGLGPAILSGSKNQRSSRNHNSNPPALPYDVTDSGIATARRFPEPFWLYKMWVTRTSLTRRHIHRLLGSPNGQQVTYKAAMATGRSTPTSCG